MECVIFIGIQASGKSTFYKEKFYDTHVRINLDMLKTRHREHIFVDASINAKQPFVIDNTNSTKTDRQKYMDAARSQQFKVTGYYFEPNLEESMARNDKRSQGKVPLPGLRSTLRKLQKPDFDEGFDQLYSVRIVDGVFTVSEWT